MIFESGLCQVSRHLTQRARGRGATWGEGVDLGANSIVLAVEHVLFQEEFKNTCFERLTIGFVSKKKKGVYDIETLVYSV